MIKTPPLRVRVAETETLRHCTIMVHLALCYVGAVIDQVPLEYNAAAAWTRQPCDSEARWEAFQEYRDMRPPRSLGAVAGLVKASRRRVEMWSASDGWAARVFEFDRWTDSIRVDVMLDVMNEDARERGARHVGILRDMQDAAAHVVRGWLKRIHNDPDAVLHEFAPKDVTAMIKASIMLERLVHGESTENVDNKHGFDLSRLTIDEIEMMRALEVKASSG